MLQNALLLVPLLVLVCCSQQNRPIIGIMTQPREDHPEYGSYLVASYVKLFESAGARVIPIHFDSTKEELLHIFNSINGLVFPGGGSFIDYGHDLFFPNSMYLYNLTIEANDKGDYFPVWGTCLGFEMLHIFASEIFDRTVLSSYDAWDISYPLVWSQGHKESKMFSGLLQDHRVFDDLSKYNSTMNYHKFGVSPETYKTNTKLNEYFKILATNSDRQGKEFISIVESKKYPIYAVQFHPEWPIFEWEESANVAHFQEAVRGNSHFGRFFVNECRKNNHQFADKHDERRRLIYNYKADFTVTTTGDVQTYYFPKK
ncbi:peptidase C26 [Acrasis kona]|uniref:folate gamma-glutamyl hydrolase n=1 Tax=Acrasis kona TaxID=1008807 RepID=A0AAW2Z156_9EUKA